MSHAPSSGFLSPGILFSEVQLPFRSLTARTVTVIWAEFSSFQPHIKESFFLFELPLKTNEAGCCFFEGYVCSP